MKIKMRTQATGPFFVLHAGEEYEVEDDLGQALVEGGFATLVEVHDVEKEPEPEKPARRSAKRKAKT